MAAESVSSVLMTADTVGGVWTYAVELSRALADAGVRVCLATMGARLKDHQRSQLQGIADLTLHESGFALEWMRDPWRDVERAGQWLLEIEELCEPDVVHLNQFAFGTLPFRAPRLVAAHSCVLSWWRAVHGKAAPAPWDEYALRVGQGLEGAQLVAAPTHAMLATLAQNYGFRGAHLVVPNGRDPAQFQPATKRPAIFSAGRLWDEAKNLVALDAAAAGLPWPVRVAGSCIAPHGGMLKPRRAHALGELDAHAVAREMAAAAIYAMPARYEPFGLSVLEAGLCGCALVLGDIDSLREVWGDAAAYVEPDDHRALRDTLMSLIVDRARRERLGRAARKHALQFRPQRMAQGYLGAYAQLCRKQSREQEPACA
jgi:glycosyltransferase involved in cell wall biosynthesis